MAKRKITVTVDERLVKLLRADDVAMSSVVNESLVQFYERRARREALGRMLDDWNAEHGPISEHAEREAMAAFDELDAVSRVGAP
ncbi:MAG: hypothetical protein ACR2HR_06440 [Euzebya sp.]